MLRPFIVKVSVLGYFSKCINHHCKLNIIKYSLIIGLTFSVYENMYQNIQANI